MALPDIRWFAVTLLAVSFALEVHSSAADEPAKPAAAAQNSLDGIWQGTLKVSGIELRIVFRIAADDQGRLKGTLDSPDQGVKGITVDSAALDGDSVTIEVNRIQGKFTGKFAADSSKIAGKWEQLGSKLPLELAKTDKEPTLNRPQEPKPPYPYRAEEVSYQNPAVKIKFAGTLTLPNEDKPVPAVLLITGSGPQDRDESLLGHKPFLVLADYLTRRGVAVLRVDDRGVGGSEGDTFKSTIDENASDALAGVAYLKSRPEIDSRRIGLVGHSEGGLVAPLAASRSADVAFIVMMAGTGVPGEEILDRQGKLIAAAMGVGESEIAASLELNQRIYNLLKQKSDSDDVANQVRELLTKHALAQATSGEAGQGAVEGQVAMVTSPWFRFFLTYDPRTALRKVRCPVLVINGQRDLQVDPQQNLAPIEAALKEAGNTQYTIKEFPGLNHLFQHSKTGALSEYGQIEETFAPEALELITTWILARTPK